MNIIFHYYFFHYLFDFYFEILCLFFFSFTEKLTSHYYNITLVASENSVTLNGLEPITTYFVRIIAINDLGQSEPSDLVHVQTDEETPGGPPLHLKAVSLSSTSIKVDQSIFANNIHFLLQFDLSFFFFLKVTWKTPRKELQFGLIRGYYVGYRVIPAANVVDPGGQSDFIYKTLEVKGKDSLEECTINELKRASRYEIIVQAFNSKGAGPSSEPVYVKTLEFGLFPFCFRCF